MINEYYVINDGVKEGPFTHIEIKDKQLPADVLVLSPMQENWAMAAELDEFVPYYQSIGIFLPLERNYAGFGRRLAAYLIDAVIVYVAFMLLFAGLFLAFPPLLEATQSPSFSFFDRLFSFVAFVLYDSLWESSKFQGSLGKQVMQLIVVDSEGYRLTFAQAFKRNFAKLGSAIMFAIGFLMVLWDDKKQAWHDKRADSFVIRKNVL